MNNDILRTAPTRRGILLGGAALTLVGCSGGNLIGPPSPGQIYVLHPDFGAIVDAPNVDWQLVVAEPEAAASLDTDRLALERAPNMMDYYANSQWTDRLPLVVQSLMVEAFEKSGKIRTVGRETAGIRADYVLETDIRDFEAYYAAADTPPQVRVKIVASLLGAVSREMAGTRSFEQNAQAAANDMPNITAAFSRAAGAAIQEIVGWALSAGRPKA